MTAGELVLDVLGSVLQIIILLENEATTKRIACIRTHCVLKDVFILKLIHDSLDPPQETHAKAKDASPNDDISTPMLHCWNLVLGVETNVLRTTNPLYPILTKQHVFAVITTKDIFPLSLGPVLVRLRPFHTRLAIFRRDHRFLDLASSIQSSCLKPTPDSTNRGFWVWGGSPEGPKKPNTPQNSQRAPKVINSTPATPAIVDPIADKDTITVKKSDWLALLTIKRSWKETSSPATKKPKWRRNLQEGKTRKPPPKENKIQIEEKENQLKIHPSEESISEMGDDIADSDPSRISPEYFKSNFFKKPK
ncbi:hypothetical protein AVEN_21363-1 [Araneus ventricosus]|uniref:Uncharacterized protein n=1 Tax=Araneus ventricosus TaxID=182803 RepID=A0A4Y2RXT4_ARAVE|nr:hypothetical protein AVEN_21363-1 [Araneus ventricosus]